MLIFDAMIGLTILLIGRQLFWLVVAGLGYILGLSYVTQYYQGPPHTILLISLGVGVIGAILAYTLQRTAALLVGFLAGWYLTITLLELLDWNPGYPTILAAVGGFLGLGLIYIFFDWSLIILSTLSGASLITQTLQFNPAIKTGLFFILLSLGILIQAIVLYQEEREYRR
jgi:hypothetical protein